MDIKTKNVTIRRKKIVLVGAIIFCAIFLFCSQTKADSISSIDNSSNNNLSPEDQEKLDALREKAEILRQIIEIKEKQGETLTNQLSVTDANIEKVQSQIDLSTQQISDINDQIVRIQGQINEKNEIIESQKKLLANVVQSYYEANQSGLLTAYLSGGNIASFITTKDRIAQTGDRIQELIKSISEIKNNLEVQNADLDQKKGDLVNKNQELQKQNDDLASMRAKRQALLNQTQGEEERYRQLLANVELQKKQLLDVDEFFASSGLSVDSYDKPDSKYFDSTGWYFSQRDSRWGDETIGNTRTKMKNYGCAVTSVAMVFAKHGGSMDPGDLANQPIYSGDLINWPSSWSKPKLSLISSKSHGNISWSTIDSQIKKGNPVIVYIKKTNGGGGHYVVIHHKDAAGKYVVHDPYFGSNIFLNTSRALIGAMGSSSSTVIDQMIIYN
jgi:peptidoglycan hydrolase CwlO-like protein